MYDLLEVGTMKGIGLERYRGYTIQLCTVLKGESREYHSDLNLGLEIGKYK